MNGPRKCDAVSYRIFIRYPFSLLFSSESEIMIHFTVHSDWQVGQVKIKKENKYEW